MFASLIALVTMTFSLPASTPAQAAFGTVGPLDPATKFPLWYQDANGLRLGYCFDPVNCFLGAQLPNPTLPPSVPSNFPAEMFYWDADATMPTNSGGQAFMRVGLEAAFLPGPGVVDGQQVTFGRIRFRLDNLQAGATYTITYPYGVATFVAQSALRRGINATTDVGCGAAVAGVTCDFTLALNSPMLERFLTWDPAVAPAPPAGYIGNFSVPHRVTGSPLGTNIFRVDGPNVGGPGVDRIQTDLFQVSGQIAGMAVTASPAAGTYSTAQSVTLTASDPAATIYYTTDGSNPVAPAAGAKPTPPTQLYTGPFALPSTPGTATTTTVKFLGVDATGSISAIQTQTYTIDLQPPAPVAPSVVVTASPAAGTYSTAQSVTLTASDPAATIYYTTDGSNPVVPAAGAKPTPPTQLYTGPFALPSTAGAVTTTTVKFLGVDATGSISAIQTQTYTIDLRPVAQLSPTSLNFGSVKRPATSTPQRVTLTNKGGGVLTITSIAIGGANPGDFAIAAKTCGATLAPAASCTVDVTFTPTARHARSGTLSIADNAAGSPHVVALTGTGL